MIKHSFPHPFDIAKAHEVADQAFAFYQQKYPQYHMSLVWKTPQQAHLEFQVKTIKLSGSILLEPNVVHLELKVPLMFQVFQQQALRKIDAEMKHWFPEKE